MVFIASSCALFAQDDAILVLDSLTRQPIEFVHVILKDKVTGKQFVTTTNIHGKADNQAVNPSDLILSFVGYEVKKTTILPNKKYVFTLTQGSMGLDEVVVTGQYAPVSEANSVYKIKLLSDEQIQNRGAVTLNQVLNDQLNVRITQDNVVGSGMTIQGLGDNNLKILLDGVPITGRLDGKIDLSQINLENIERIEIVEGPMSVMYGSNSLAGTINLITKKAKKNQTNYGGKFYYESVGVYNADGWLNLGGKNDIGKFTFGRNFFDGWDPIDTGRAKQWNQKEQYFGNAAYDHDFKTWKLGYMVDGLWEQVKDKGDRRSEYSNYAFDDWYTTTRLINTLKADINSIDKYNLNILGSYTMYERSKVRYNRDLVNLTQEPTSNPTDHDTTNINSIMMRSVLSSGYDGKLNYQIGLDFNWENITGGRVLGTPEIGDYALFTNLKWELTKQFTIQPALRFAYNTNYTAPVVPSINFQYKHEHNWQVRLSYAQGFRAPSLKELYLEFVDANHNILGNPNLEPENSRHLHAFFSWNHNYDNVHQLKIEPSLFYNDIDNMINLTQIQGTYFTYLNVDNYTTFGGKVEVNYAIHPDFDFKFGYSHIAYSNRLYDEVGGDKFLYSPEFSASFNYWRANKKFRFNVFYKYNGAIPTFRAGDNGDAIQVLLPAYNTMDVTASYSFWKNKLTVSGGAKNLFDVTNLGITNGSGGVHSGDNFVVSWGRSYFLSLKFSFL